MSDAVLAKKLCNALIPDAEVASGIPGAAVRAAEEVRESAGGLWVGGTARLTASAVTFEPNALNRAVHAHAPGFALPLARMVAAERRGGFVTGIIVMTMDTGATFAVRCYGATAFCARIEAAREAAQSGATTVTE